MMLTKSKLTTENWKKFELPTKSWRSKIFSNLWKEQVLKETHDPFINQSSEFIAALSSIDFPQDKPFDYRTYEKWWAGDIFPGLKKINVMRLSVKEIGGQGQGQEQAIAQWLEPKSITLPFLRHLRSIDGRNLGISDKKDLEHAKNI